MITHTGSVVACSRELEIKNFLINVNAAGCFSLFIYCIICKRDVFNREKLFLCWRSKSQRFIFIFSCSTKDTSRRNKSNQLGCNGDREKRRKGYHLPTLKQKVAYRYWRNTKTWRHSYWSYRHGASLTSSREKQSIRSVRALHQIMQSPHLK